MKLSEEAMAAAKRIAERKGVDVKKVIRAYAKAATSSKTKLNTSVLFLD